MTSPSGMINPTDTAMVIIAYALSLALLLGYSASLLLRYTAASRHPDNTPAARDPA